MRGDIPGLWTPGQNVVSYPDGLVMRARAGTMLIAEVHYHAPATAATDRTEVRVWPTDSVASPGRMMLADALVDTLFQGQPAQLAPGQPTVDYRWTLRYEGLIENAPGVLSQGIPPRLDVYGAFPHMHELGRTARARRIATAPGRAPHRGLPHDYDWQQIYFHEQPLAMFPRSQLDVACRCDTRNRTETVSAGFATTDEMCSFILFEIECAAP